MNASFSFKIKKRKREGERRVAGCLLGAKQELSIIRPLALWRKTEERSPRCYYTTVLPFFTPERTGTETGFFHRRLHAAALCSKQRPAASRSSGSSITTKIVPFIIFSCRLSPSCRFFFVRHKLNSHLSQPVQQHTNNTKISNTKNEHYKYYA